MKIWLVVVSQWGDDYEGLVHQDFTAFVSEAKADQYAKSKGRGAEVWDVEVVIE